MINDGTPQENFLGQIIRGQIDFLLAMLARPVVQQQLLVILAILLIAWTLPEILRRRRRPGGAGRYPQGEGVSLRQRVAWFAHLLLAPIVALVLLALASRLYALRGLPDGLLADVTILVWMWLAYRGLVVVLYILFGEAVRPYRRWIVTPAFVILVIAQAINMLPGTVTLVDATIRLGTLAITLSNLLLALLTLYLFIIAGWVIGQSMMRWLPDRTGAEQGVIDSIATLTRYALISVGIVLALSVLGLDFTSLAIIAGGLSVGIGIGMQEFVANFISGLVLLFEQTLRPGDVIEVDNRISRVQKISLRATTVRTLTNQELVIPNSNFTSQQVTNLTKSDRIVRVLVPFSVSYKSKPDEVREVAGATALQHELVLAEPPPFVAFLGYGESSLDFNLSVSVDQPDRSGRVRSDLYYMLWDAFAAHGIEIPFPQRDLNLGDGWEKLAGIVPHSKEA